MKKAYPRPSSKPVRKISFSRLSDSLPGLICHYSLNGRKNLRSYYSYAGGLAGHNGGSISNSYATGNASPSSSPARSYAGGLAGYSDSGHISNSYAAGSASSLLSLNRTVVPGTVWGRSDAKNDKLPYINGVGVGK